MAKKQEETTEFINPWMPKVSYKEFLDAIPSGMTPREYLTGKLGVDNEKELITWLEGDLEQYKNNLKNK